MLKTDWKEQGFIDEPVTEGTDLKAEIRRLCKEKDAIILAHYYTIGDIQDIADFVGDSLALARKAAETDAKIRAALSEYMGKRTVILISHRISTLRAADQILVLKDGKVSGVGTHEELMQSNEIYRKVAEIQSAGLEEVYETVGSVTNKETDPPEGEPKETIAETNPARPDGQVAMDLEQKKEETGVSKAGEEAQHE